MLAATILLGSYELLAKPGVDYQKHLFGARTLIQSFNVGSKGSRFEQASFRIYARQDVALALVNERPTLTSPEQWPPLPKHASSVEERLGNTILWLLAKIIELKFSEREDNSLGGRLDALHQLLSEIDLLWSKVPYYVRGVHMREFVDENEKLPRVWFCDPAAGNSCHECFVLLVAHLTKTGAACLDYHMAKILALECVLDHETRCTSSSPQQNDYLLSIRQHAREISSICLSAELSDGAMVVAVNPAFYGITSNNPSLECACLTLLSGKTCTLDDTEGTTVGDSGYYSNATRILYPR